MKILYVAYSCDPYNGSEDKFGWNIPYIYSKNNPKDIVYLITKEEQKTNVEKYIKENNIKNIFVYYIDIPNIYKNIFKGPLYSGRLNIWHRRVFKLIKRLVEENNIDIIHQITPVEFRSIGKYYNINNIKFIVGPIGGGEYIPNCLKTYLNKKDKLLELIRKSLNAIYRKKFLKIKNKISFVLYANKETAEYLGDFNNDNIYTEIGIKKEEISTNIKNNKENIFIVPGRLIYRKGHKLLFDALSKLDNNLSYKVKIIGDGPLFEELKRIANNDPNLKEHIVFYGKIDYEKMIEEYRNCKAIIMPSLRETTGTVMLEAISNGKPVITYDGFGAKVMLNKNDNCLYSGKTKEEIIEKLSNNIEKVINSSIDNASSNLIEDAKKFTFEKKCSYYNIIYKNIIDNNNIKTV